MCFQGLSGIAGGIGLVMDPTGRLIQMPLEWLKSSPFNDYLIPGVILLTILGVFPLYVFYALLKKQRSAWFGSLFVAIALIIWIGVEILIIGYYSQPPLQLIYLIVGMAILILVLLPSVQNCYRTIDLNKKPE